MRRGRATALVASIATAALVTGALPAVAQEDEEFPQPGAALPLDGYTRTDGTIVLSDTAFCRHLLGGLWGDDELTFTNLIDKTKKQKRARAAAFEPGSDDDTLTRCADIIGAFRSEPPDDDTLAAWARRSPVVPEALAGLLPDDLLARPLARPEEVGDAARTSGYGDTVSAPFHMDAETWLAEVDALDCGDWTGSLRNARDADTTIELTAIREYLYNVDPGHYYWEVSAPDCDWSVDLVPIELGPDPNATPLPRIPVPKLHGDLWARGQVNEPYLTATQARQALLDAGLTVGGCVEERSQGIDAGRVWGQDPMAGTLLEAGSSVDVFATTDCDVVLGDRVIIE